MYFDINNKMLFAKIMLLKLDVAAYELENVFENSVLSDTQCRPGLLPAREACPGFSWASFHIFYKVTFLIMSNNQFSQEWVQVPVT